MLSEDDDATAVQSAAVNISDENQNSALPAALVWIIALGGWDYDKSHPDNL